MQDTTVRRSILTLAVVAGLGSASIAGDVVWQSHQDRPDPTCKEHPEPKITTPPGVLQFVMPGGTSHRMGEVFHFTGAEAFAKPAPDSGTVNPNAHTDQREILALSSKLSFAYRERFPPMRHRTTRPFSRNIELDSATPS